MKFDKWNWISSSILSLGCANAHRVCGIRKLASSSNLLIYSQLSRVYFTIKGMGGGEYLYHPWTPSTIYQPRDLISEIWIFLLFNTQNFIPSFLFPSTIGHVVRSISNLSKNIRETVLLTDYTRELNFIVAISGTSRSREPGHKAGKGLSR